MKSILLIAIMLTICFSVCGQRVKKNDVPSLISTRFTSNFPRANRVKWSKENGLYETEFKQNKIEMSVVYDSLGTTLETESEITVANMPVGISKYIATNVPGGKIKEASIMTDANGVISYEAEVKGVDYVFDKDGIFIKKSGEKKEKD